MTKTTPTILPQPRAVKRLLVDIEVSPNTVLTWRVGHDIDVSYDGIVNERAIICVCWKWAGEKKVYSATWDKKQNDKGLLAELVPFLNEADEVIGHNLGRFDLPWTKTRALLHGIPTQPAYKVVDTLRLARSQFHFNSNRLDYIAKFLGVGSKIKTGFELWKAIVLRNDAKALAKMVRYCKNDVVILERVWERLVAVTTHTTHAAVLAGGTKWACPHCASENVHLNKTKVAAGGGVKYGFQCSDCGRYFTVGPAAYNAYVKAKELEA